MLSTTESVKKMAAGLLAVFLRSCFKGFLWVCETVVKPNGSRVEVVRRTKNQQTGQEPIRLTKELREFNDKRFNAGMMYV